MATKGRWGATKTAVAPARGLGDRAWRALRRALNAAAVRSARFAVFSEYIAMKMRFRSALALTCAAGVAAMLSTPVLSQKSAPAPARYTVDAGTASGMAAMAGGGAAAAMAMLGGGGNQAVRELYLRLGSAKAPQGEAKADHFLPDGTRLGASVPLLTPRAVRDDGPAGNTVNGPMQMPKGRLLLFWGCGEKAGPGQPLVIDFSKMAAGQVPPGLYSAAVDAAEAWQVNAANARTYGEWPNQRSDKRVPANASLLGAHRIASNYAPEIAFNLTDDFMPALRPVTRDVASGAVSLGWNALPTATGYYATAIATGKDGGDGRDMVWWSSSSTQQFGGPMADWLSPAAVRKLVAAKTVMPASQTSCTIPAEVKAAGGPMLMTSLYGYGPQADFSHPARPAKAPAGWQPEWIARVRFRSNAMVMHGMGDAMAAGDEDEASAAPAQQSKPRCKGLAGIAARAAGLCQ